MSGDGCKRYANRANVAAEEEDGDGPTGEQSKSQRLQRGEIWNKGNPLDVLAAWYDVPDKSLAKRRADGEEFTAANNRLPVGTLVKVTNPRNGKTVYVRITDRGIHNHRIKLDLCKEAAEQLDIVGAGLAKVRMQVVTERAGDSGSATPTAATP